MQASVHCRITPVDCADPLVAAAEAAARSHPAVLSRMQQLQLPLERMRAVPLLVDVLVAFKGGEDSLVDVPRQLQQ